MPACLVLPRVALVALLAAQPAIAQMAPTDSTDWRAAAGAVVNRLALVRAERVLLVGVAGVADALVPELRAAIRAAGGTDLGAISDRRTAPASWSTDFTRDLGSKTGAAFDEALRTVDAAVMMPGATPEDRTYAGMQRVLESGRARTVHFHWAGAYDETGTLLPTTPDVARFYLHALKDTDYAALAAKQRAFEAAMRGKVIRVTTPAGTDIRFRIGNRTVTKQDGDASAARTKFARVLIDREIELPAGAIRVAPIEESVEGTIAFPPSMWGSTRVEGLVLAFANGRVTEVRATTGREAVGQEIEAAGDAGRSFREFALGLNPLLAIPTSGTRWIPYYGYGAGVVRLSLGDNTELGGNVRGGYVRWNFFTNATLTVGSDVWVKDGRLIR